MNQTKLKDLLTNLVLEIENSNHHLTLDEVIEKLSIEIEYLMFANELN